MSSYSLELSSHLFRLRKCRHLSAGKVHQRKRMTPTITWVINSSPSWAKWPSFSRRYLQTHYHEWKVLYFDLNFTGVCSQVSNWQYLSIGLDKGLAPNKRQAIIWTNADPIRWRIYAAQGGDALRRLDTLIDTRFREILVDRLNDLIWTITSLS